MVHGFFELPEADRPHERIWKNGKKLAAHWDIVRARHEAKNAGMELVDDSDTGDMQNPITAKWKR